MRFAIAIDANNVPIETEQIPENALTDNYSSQMAMASKSRSTCRLNLAICRSSETLPLPGRVPIWRCIKGILGYEWNTVHEDAYRPDGLIRLSLTTRNRGSILIDQGNTIAPGIATHSLALYRDPQSGALVFGPGPTFWTWTLCNEHDSAPYGATMANATVHLFKLYMIATWAGNPASQMQFLRLRVWRALWPRRTDNCQYYIEQYCRYSVSSIDLDHLWHGD